MMHLADWQFYEQWQPLLFKKKTMLMAAKMLLEMTGCFCNYSSLSLVLSPIIGIIPAGYDQDYLLSEPAFLKKLKQCPALVCSPTIALA